MYLCSMPAGRPHNSTTPPWNSEPAIKVAVYRFLMKNKRKKESKSGCARFMKISRTTVVKWWDIIEWSKEDYKNITTIRKRWNDKYSDEKNIKVFSTKYGMEDGYIRTLVAVLSMLFGEGHMDNWSGHYTNFC